MIRIGSSWEVRLKFFPSVRFPKLFCRHIQTRLAYTPYRITATSRHIRWSPPCLYTDKWRRSSPGWRCLVCTKARRRRCERKAWYVWIYVFLSFLRHAHIHVDHLLHPPLSSFLRICNLLAIDIFRPIFNFTSRYPGVPHGFAQHMPQLKISQKWRNEFHEGIQWLLQQTQTQAWGQVRILWS